jgi:hypothetical protein
MRKPEDLACFFAEIMNSHDASRSDELNAPEVFQQMCAVGLPGASA